MPQRASGAFLICHKRKAANVDGGRARGLGIPVGGLLRPLGEESRILQRNLSARVQRKELSSCAMSWLRSSATLIAVLASENRIVDVILPPEFEVRKPLLLRTPFGSVRSSNSLAACLAAVALSEFAKSISFCRLKCLIASSSNGSNGTGASSLASAFAMRSFHGCTAPLWLAHALRGSCFARGVGTWWWGASPPSNRFKTVPFNPFSLRRSCCAVWVVSPWRVRVD